MSMKILTILQFSGVFAAYLLVTVLVPAFVLHARIRTRRLAEKFLICFLTGNFYLMNLVFVLQLLRISNTFTLIAGTVVPAFIIWLRLNHISFVNVLKNCWIAIRRMTAGHLGIKTVVFRFGDWLKDGWKRCAKAMGMGIVKRPLEWMFVMGILALMVSFYGIQLLRGYGYTASDTPVHLYWINGMENNQIFIDGVYPFGYHCIIYYIHKVFSVDSYVMMRVFSFVQNIMLHLVLLVFIRLCCKSRYVAYGAVALFVIGDIFQPGTYFRFFSVLPQEYGMIFILPAIYFAFRFFEVRRRELKKGKKKKESLVCLLNFGMSFSMTLAVHFYDTMIVGLFCVGVAVGYIGWFIRKQYFWTVVVTCFISVMVAVLPMGIAFATGTPLQGSLGWGMSVINGGDEEASNPDGSNNTVIYYDANGNEIQPGTGSVETGSGEKKEQAPVVREKLVAKVARVVHRLSRSVDELVISERLSGYHMVVMYVVGALFVLGIFFYLFKTLRCYGAMLVSTGTFMVLMLMLQSAYALGLPELMDASRCRIYLSYMIPVAVAFVVDAVIRLVCFKRSWVLLRNLISLACVAVVVIFLYQPEHRKEQVESTTLVTDEAITCLTNIMKEENDFTWTICSANDETQMTINNGYHYETISFLREMEYNNMKRDAKPVVQIPTETVYFFIEKVPLDYAVAYEGSGQKISEQGAIRDLPNVGGINMYQGEFRWIVMSRMYYWAQKFQQLYPNEMKVYCETDDFICYRIEQNTYRLYNFAIDYEYNTRRWGGKP